MTHEKANKIQGIILALDAMNQVSRIACAVKHDTEIDEWGCYIYAKESDPKLVKRVEKSAQAIWQTIDDIYMREDMYNVGTTEVKWAKTWQLF